jgi:putative glutamine amidotransferase
VVTAARGGTLVTDMGDGCHRHVVQEVQVEPGTRLARALGTTSTKVSCYHHQCVRSPGQGMVAVAHADDGTPEAYEIPEHPGWFVGVQWHPEDTADADPGQARLFSALVDAARSRSARGERRSS